MSRCPRRTSVEIPHKLEDDGELLLVTADVTLGRFPAVDNVLVLNERTRDEVEFLPEWAKESITDALITEAERMWRTP